MGGPPAKRRIDARLAEKGRRLKLLPRAAPPRSTSGTSPVLAYGSSHCSIIVTAAARHSSRHGIVVGAQISPATTSLRLNAPHFEVFLFFLFYSRAALFGVAPRHCGGRRLNFFN